MSVAEFYPWLKALHVAAVLTFVGGLLAVTIVLGALRAAPGHGVQAAARRWDRSVTTPAMLIVWMSGLTLGLSGHLFGDHWLQAKLVFVVALSGIHGVLSGRLRRAATGLAGDGQSLGPVIVGAATIIAVLAVVKP